MLLLFGISRRRRRVHNYLVVVDVTDTTPVHHRPTPSLDYLTFRTSPLRSRSK